MKQIQSTINFFDLDGVLWETNSKIWIIDKENPVKPIIRLDKSESTNILMGIYFKDDLKIEYNGEEYFISQDIMNKIQRKKKLSIERLGLSWIEFYDSKYINNTKIKYLLNNIKHLRNENNYICILTGRAYQDRHAKILNSLRLSLLDIGIDIYKIYFVSKRFHFKHTEEISLNKSHILLEHMIGLKIEDGKFVPKKQDWYSEVHFYDDNKMNIDYANDIQVLFDRIMKKTDDELFTTIIDRVENNPIKLVTHLVTGNSVNRFSSSELYLTEPVRFPIK